MSDPFSTFSEAVYRNVVRMSKLVAFEFAKTDPSSETAPSLVIMKSDSSVDMFVLSPRIWPSCVRIREGIMSGKCRYPPDNA